MEQIYNSLPPEQKKPPMTLACPVPTSMLPFLEKRGLRFRISPERSMISNVANIEIDIRSGLDITNIIYAAFEHDIHESAANVNRHYSFKNKAA